MVADDHMPIPMNLSFLKTTATALFASAALSASGQISTTAYDDAMSFANALLSGSSGITINSASYTGATHACGYFTSTSGILPFTSGIVLTSGSRTNVQGLNTSTGISTSNGLAGDAGLTAIAGATYDASVLEIHFTPTNNVISFQYVFGSEEYNEYVDHYNDVFAFFLNGLNIALVPGTSTAVSINNVNLGDYPQYYYDNTTGSLPTQMDGLVGRNAGFYLYAMGAVNAGVENVMRIAIADGGDTALDSAVFLAAGSFIDDLPPLPGAVPEPSTYGLIGVLSLLAMVAWRRKQARKA